MSIEDVFILVKLLILELSKYCAKIRASTFKLMFIFIFHFVFVVECLYFIGNSVNVYLLGERRDGESIRRKAQQIP